MRSSAGGCTMLRTAPPVRGTPGLVPQRGGPRAARGFAMRRISVVISILVLGLVGLLSASQTTAGVNAQDATPASDTHALVGSWVVHETLPPGGGPPVLAGVFTYFADGNVLVSGFGANQPSLQGSWSASGDRMGTFTVIG